MSTTLDASAFVNAIACDLEEGGFRQVSGTTLRRTLATAVSTALPLLADTGIPTSQPAEVAEQQGVDRTAVIHALADAYSAGAERLQFAGNARCDALLAALAATGKQQAGEVQGDAATHDKAADLISRLCMARDMQRAGAWSYLFAEAADALAAIAARQPGAQGPVAVVGPDFTLLWVGSGPISPIVERHGLRRGSLLYAAPPAQGIDLGPLRRLYQAYVRLLESGRDRIIDFGGTCDPVDVMERTDVDLIEPRNLLRQYAAAPGVGNG